MTIPSKSPASVHLERPPLPDRELSPSPPKYPYPSPTTVPTALPKSAPVLLEAPKGVMEEVSNAPKCQPSPPTHTRPQVTTPAPPPPKTEPERPIPLWERQKLQLATSEGGSSGGNAETIVIPAPAGTGDCPPVFTGTPRDVKRENQRENLVEGFLGSNPARRRNDSAWLWARPPAPTPAPAPAPPQKTSSWGSWGPGILDTVASAVNTERAPFPEPLSVKPKFGELPKGPTPTMPPKGRPAVETGVPAKEEEMFGSESEFTLPECMGTKDQVTPVVTVPSTPDVPDPDNGLMKKKKGRR